jgi:hypothetical protein
MMTQRFRPPRILPGVIALALFCAWLGAGLSHQHATAPACQTCKILQTNPVDLAARGVGPEAPGPAEGVLPSLPGLPSAPLAILPHGRAPPTA